MNDTASVQVYVTSIEEVLWGGALMAITMVMHGLGMLLTLDVAKSYKRHYDVSKSFMLGMSVIVLASWGIIMVHLMEVIAWAAFFVWTNAMPNISTSFYFALMDYTTVGSSYHLPDRWRLLEGLLPASGLLTFAWSTSVLFTLAKDFQEQQMEILKARREDRRQNSKHSGGRPSG